MEAISLKSKVVNGVFWLGGTKTVGQAISWLITIYVIRILSPADYGLMGMATLLTGFIVLFNEIGIGSAIIQKKDLSSDEISSIRWAIMFINVVIFLFILIIAPLVSSYFGEPRLTSIIRYMSITFIINSFGLVSSYLLTRNMSFDKRSQAEFIGGLVSGISTLLLAIKGFGVWSLVNGLIIGTLVSNILYVFFYPLKFKYHFSYNEIKSTINFGLSILASRILWYWSSNADFLIAGKLLGKVSLGYYALAFQFASIPIDKIVSLITQVATPLLSKVQDDDVLLKKHFFKILRILSFVLFPVFMLLFLEAEDIVSVFLTNKWLPIVFPLRVLCIVSCLRSIEFLNAPLVLAKGKPNLVVQNYIVIGIVLPISFYIGSKYGINGLSLSWLYIFPLVFLFTAYRSINLIGISLFEYLKELKHSFIGTFVTTIIIYYYKTVLLNEFNYLANMIATTVAFLALYAIYILIFQKHLYFELKTLFK